MLSSAESWFAPALSDSVRVIPSEWDDLGRESAPESVVHLAAWKRHRTDPDSAWECTTHREAYGLEPQVVTLRRAGAAVL